jgi:hypothetical protein
MPYPLTDVDTAGNATLAGIKPPDAKNSAFGVQAAVDEFYRMRRGG